MGKPVFDRSKRYVNKEGKKFGKGVWLGYNKVIQPGWGDFDRKSRTVTQYNTDGTKSVFSWEDWQDKKTKDHELRVLQNDRKYGIPYVPSKKMTISIDKNSATNQNEGATFSENLLDSIAVNAKKAGLPFGTALGIAAQESTLGHDSSRTVGNSMLPLLYSLNSSDSKAKETAQGISYQDIQSPSLLISNWKRISENPFARYQYDAQGDLLTTPMDAKYYDEDFNSALRRSNNYSFEDASPLYHGFKLYKEHPKKYNPKDPDYPKKVETNKEELVNHSPEIKAYMRKNNLHVDGGYLNDNLWNSLSMKEKSEMMKVAISNGITSLPEIREAYNKFAKGGKKNTWTMQDEYNYRAWRSKLPSNLRNTNDSDYDMRAAFKAGMEPQWNEEDKSYHLGSRDPESGRILKSPHHPTFLKALATDASMGYYPTMDNVGNTYTETWKDNRYDLGGNLYYKGGRKGVPVNANSQRAMSYLLNKGMSRTGASAIVGTLQAESNLDPTIHAKMKGDNGEGIAQWTGSRKKNFWKTLEQIEPGAQRRYKNIANVPLERQLDVVLSERPTVTKAIHGAGDVGTATDIMLRGYENGGGTVGSMASRKQMDSIYGKWNNGYGNQMKKRLGNASVLLGSHIDPSSYEMPQGFFTDIDSQLQLPSGGFSPSMDVDPSTIYKAPVIDPALLADDKPEVEELPVYDPRQERLEGLKNLGNVMGMLGQSNPLVSMSGGDDTPGLLSYVSQIYGN